MLETTLIAMELEEAGYRFDYDRTEKCWTCWDAVDGTEYGPYETVRDAIEGVLQRHDGGEEL